MIVFTLLVCAVILLCFAYINGKYNERYWKKRNVAFYSKHKVTGVFWDFLFNKKSVFLNLGEIYKDFRNEPAVGIGTLLTPTLYVTNPTNIQHVLATDFNSFNHRGVDINQGDQLADNILFMNGNRWKLMRQNMTPLFTSTKLKSMYYIIDKSATDLVEHLKANKELLKGNAFDTLSSFCSAAIGAAVFGVSTGSIFESPFLDMARNASLTRLKDTLKMTVGSLSNRLFSVLGLKLFKDHEDFFIGAIKQIIRLREQEKTKRHDFADICVELQKAGNLVDKDTGLEIEPTDEILAAQAFFFFIAGVEPTAQVLFGTLLELGRHPEHLQKLQNEIDETFKAHNNKINFDVIGGMKYLDMVVSEAMRMHPPIGFLTRQCVKDTVLPVGNIKVDKGTKIMTPILEVHYDERYYSEPKKFMPERFAPENKHKLVDAAYMPFGKGNRICVGTRYATLQTKAGLVHLLRNFSVNTIIKGDGPKYILHPMQVRLENIDVEFIPRSREQEKTKRHDFADICVELQKAGNLVDKDTGLEIEPTDEILAAQAFFFFIAGVEPTAQVLFGTLLELGRHPEHLQKVQNEIDETFKEHNNKINFDVIWSMKYLDMVVSEAMRMHPPIGFLTRQCVKDTVLPVGNIKVEKGTKMITPVLEVHYDERYYSEPKKFMPERFAPENKHKLVDAAYMPFGKGNRICVGMRYATLQTKAGLVHLLRNFSVNTIIKGDGPKYVLHPLQVRLKNIDVEFIPRSVPT
ncbi:cytochrome P450 6B7-like [Zerene cesonia]|uniref:cytochrome P450 6B7-like n=1 Tax=Zerene cesonia TaxID=33412 RepID=UPI0018E57580|nr:cytochrome P450 6B7-like [Zerene cesonia]